MHRNSWGGPLQCHRRWLWRLKTLEKLASCSTRSVQDFVTSLANLKRLAVCDLSIMADV